MPLKQDFFTGSRPKNPWENFNFPVTPPVQQPMPNMYRPQPPQNPALDEYINHTRNMPNEADYSPSIWRRIAAGAVGGLQGAATSNPMAAWQSAENINRTPYRNALATWDIQGEGLKSVANLENQGLTQRRLYQGQDINNENFDQRTIIAEKDSRIREFNAQTARTRTEFQNKIALADNEIDRERLSAQKEQWETLNKRDGDRLIIERDRAGAYRSGIENQNRNRDENTDIDRDTLGSMSDYRNRREDRLGSRNDNPTDTQLSARRRMASERVINENPEWFNPNSIIPLPEYAPLVEEKIQQYMKPRRYGDINLEPGKATSEWEEIK